MSSDAKEDGKDDDGIKCESYYRYLLFKLYTAAQLIGKTIFFFNQGNCFSPYPETWFKSQISVSLRLVSLRLKCLLQRHSLAWD